MTVIRGFHSSMRDDLTGAVKFVGVWLSFVMHGLLTFMLCPSTIHNPVITVREL